MKTRKLSYQLKWHFDFNHSIEKVWPHISNTDRMNRAVGLPEVQYQSVPNPLGGSTRYGEARIAGFKLKWMESPYEWVIYDKFGVNRDYSQGPLKAMDIAWKLTPTPSGCRVTQTVTMEPRSKLSAVVSLFQLKKRTKKAFLTAYKEIDDYLSKPVTPFFTPTKSNATIDEKLFSDVIKQFEEVQIQGEMAEKIAKLILIAPAPDLVRIKPFYLARVWALDRVEVLKALLRATNRGVLNLYWDLVCPRCLGAKKRITQLSSIKNKVHCDSCNIDFLADFHKSVEVSFSVHPNIRKISVGEYCVGGPQNTPHFVAQVRLAPKETATLDVTLEEGVYRARSLQAKGWRLFDVRNNLEKNEAAVVFNSIPQEEEKTLSGAGVNRLQLVNEQSHEIVVSLNRVAWMEDVCTASYVTSLQEFKNRFSADVLDPTQEIFVSRMTLLFSDLKNSTKLYQNIGDAKAYRLIREHFELLSGVITRHEGSVIKSLGDSIMASFSSPALALEAALEIQNSFRTSPLFEEQTSLKIGIHTGSCFVITNDGKLDYFGSNVNIASRAHGQCDGGDIILTQYMMNDEGVRNILAERAVAYEKIIRNLKGFDAHFVLYQIKCSDTRATRIA